MVAQPLTAPVARRQPDPEQWHDTRRHPQQFKDHAKQGVSTATGRPIEPPPGLCQNGRTKQSSRRQGSRRRVVDVLSLIPRVFFSGLRYFRRRVVIRTTACAALMSVFSSPLLAANTIVGMETSLGSFNIELDNDAPLTVENFLGYLNRGDYNNLIIHRSPPGFVVQR